jgi:hypothetical protein
VTSTDNRPAAGARPAVAALALFALVDMISTLLMIGHYEHRITVVTHGSPDLGAAMFAYDLFDFVLDGLGLGRGPRTADLARQWIWLVALVVAVAAVAVWRHRARKAAPVGRTTLRWVGAAAVLSVVSAVYRAATAPSGVAVAGFLDNRPVAYLLWAVSTAVVVTACARLAAAIRRSAAEQPRVTPKP